MGSPILGETDREHSDCLLGDKGLGSTLEDECFRLFLDLEVLSRSLLSFLSLDLPDFLDLELFRALLLESLASVEEYFSFAPVGSNAECHELVSSEHTEENLCESMAGSEFKISGVPLVRRKPVAAMHKD